MNQLQIFSNPEFGQVRMIEEDGKVLFCGKDVADALGYSRARDAIRVHCRGAVKRSGVSYTTNQPGKKTSQVTEMNYIPEGDVYRLIIRSKLPAAERFETWVFDEVLPSIRKQGGYSTSQFDVLEIIQQTAAVVVAEVVKQLVPLFHQKAPVQEPATTVASFGEISDFYNVPVSRCKIETFPEGLRHHVDKMMEQMVQTETLNFSQIARFCTANGCLISSPSVKRYFVKYFAG